MTPKNNNWKWFFLIVAVLALAASIFLVVFNMRQQLKPEELEAARQLWIEHGPASYTLIYTEKFSSQAGNELKNHYVVKVRDRKVTEVLVNGAPKEERLEYHDMNGLFNEVEAFQDKDSKEKRRVYCRARFDDDTGAIREYVRYVPNSSERQQIDLELIEAK
jgi:hypothetical protein